MFDLNGFIKKGLMDAVGKLADYQVTFIAAYWFDKHVLNEADMSDIAAAINVTVSADGCESHDGIPMDVTIDYCDFCLGEPPNNEIWE